MIRLIHVIPFILQIFIKSSRQEPKIINNKKIKENNHDFDYYEKGLVVNG